MKTIVQLESDGAATITRDHETQQENGTPNIEQWRIEARQVEKHLPMFNDSATAIARVSPGEASALRDIANEQRKQRDS